MTIQVLKPVYGPEEAHAVIEVLRSGWTGLGPKVAEFETEFAKYLEVQPGCVVGVSSGTAALELALRAAGVGSGMRDEVIVPALTFVSTAHAVLHAGAVPVFADISPETLTLDPADVRQKISRHTRAVLPVHLAGVLADRAGLQDVLSAHPQVRLIEDAAHACGAGIRPLSAFATCFSFHAVKNLSMGEGGAVVVQDEETARHLKRLRWLGISKDTVTRTAQSGAYAWQYDVLEDGYKAHLSDIAAAIGLVQLAKLDENNCRRKEITQIYFSALGNVPWLELPPANSTSWHLFIVRLPDETSRNAMIRHLKDRDIHPGVHYFPIHKHPFYLARCPETRLPVTEAVAPRLLSLPLHLGLTDADVWTVIDAVQEFRP